MVGEVVGGGGGLMHDGRKVAVHCHDLDKTDLSVFCNQVTI